MAISLTRYVDITSGVGGNAAVRQRDFILRLFTSSTLVPTSSQIEFDNADDVGTYFGFSSSEYLRAVYYFGWVSKNTTKPEKISFASWTPTAVAPRIYGVVADYPLANFTSVVDGAITLTIGSSTATVTGIDLSAAASLSAVAALIQTAVRSYTAGGSNWTAASVTYDATRKSFNLVGGATGNAVMAVGTPSTGTNLMTRLGWTSLAILSNGQDAQTLTQTVVASAGASDNFGSFAFIGALSTQEITELAQWNHAQNNKYMFLFPTLKANAATLYASTALYSGAGMTISEIANEYPEIFPAMILAATNYARRNSTQNYMFQQSVLTPSVQTNAEANTYDAIRANYYGRTQTAGTTRDFYQRGTLMGGDTAAVDMNTYANEMYLKDAASAALMSLLLALSKISANDEGRGQLMSVLQEVANQALFNGTISVGKDLTINQKQYITQLTGDELAWIQVQSIGYWLDVTFQQVVTQTNAVEFQAVYTLCYSKDDTIRKVVGTHSLI